MKSILGFLLVTALPLSALAAPPNYDAIVKHAAIAGFHFQKKVKARNLTVSYGKTKYLISLKNNRYKLVNESALRKRKNIMSKRVQKVLPFHVEITGEHPRGFYHVGFLELHKGRKGLPSTVKPMFHNGAFSLTLVDPYAKK